MASDAYPPDLMELMSAAFDAAYERVLGEPSQAYQLQLATRIIAAVNAGERDVARLAAFALGEIVLEAPDGAPRPEDEPESAEPSSAA